MGGSGTAGLRARAVVVRRFVVVDDRLVVARRRLPGTAASSPPARDGVSGHPAPTAPGTLPPMLLLVPRDPLAPRRVDPHLAGEAAAAREPGVPVALVDRDELDRPDGDAGVRRVVELGDGQASDRPSSIPAADLVGAPVAA